MGGRIATGELLAVRGDVAVNVPAAAGVPPSVREYGGEPASPTEGCTVLEPTLAEIEAHLHAGGWDRPPSLFALVRAERFLADDPDTGRRLGLDQVAGSTLTPVEQEALPEGPLDEVLAGLAWPDGVEGCALSQEIVVLPPAAEGGLSDDEAAARAADHPDRREARLVAGVLRDGTAAVLLRLRSPGAGEADDLLTGPDLAPNLTAALLATLRD